MFGAPNEVRQKINCHRKFAVKLKQCPKYGRNTVVKIFLRTSMINVTDLPILLKAAVFLISVKSKGEKTNLYL